MTFLTSTENITLHMTEHDDLDVIFFLHNIFYVFLVFILSFLCKFLIEILDLGISNGTRHFGIG